MKCGETDSDECSCGHDIDWHKDADGGTHECIYPACDCQQFAFSHKTSEEEVDLR